MKGLITDEFLTVEAKFVNAVRARNLLHVIIASNETWTIPADCDVRRFSVLRFGEEHKDDHKYFRAMWEQLHDGGFEALLHHLLYEVDLDGFNPRKHLDTKELIDQKQLSLTGIEAIFFECLVRGTLPARELNGDGSVNLRGQDLIDWAREKRLRGSEYVSTVHVGYLFKGNPKWQREGLGFEKHNPQSVLGRVNVWKIPPLKEAREHWDKYRFKVDWDAKNSAGSLWGLEKLAAWKDGDSDA